jgi:predicted ester cyclase
MSVEANKALWRRFYEEVWDRGNTDFAYEVFSDDYVRHDLRPTQALSGPAGQKRIADDFRAAFPDLRVAVDLIVGEDDFVVGRWTATGRPTSGRGAASHRPAGRSAFPPSTSVASRTGRSLRSGTIATTSA